MVGMYGVVPYNIVSHYTCEPTVCITHCLLSTLRVCITWSLGLIRVPPMCGCTYHLVVASLSIEHTLVVSPSIEQPLAKRNFPIQPMARRCRHSKRIASDAHKLDCNRKPLRIAMRMRMRMLITNRNAYHNVSRVTIQITHRFRGNTLAVPEVFPNSSET